MTALLWRDECELCFTCVVFSSRHACLSWWPAAAAQGWLFSMKLCVEIRMFLEGKTQTNIWSNGGNIANKTLVGWVYDRRWGDSRLKL